MNLKHHNTRPTLALAGCLAAVLAVLLMAAGPAVASCADATSKAAVRYLSKAIKGRQNCFAKAVKDNEPHEAADQCFGTLSELDTDEGIGKRLDRARKKMRARLTKSCVGVNLADLGFPGPCNTSDTRRICRADTGATQNFGHACTTDAYCGGAGCATVFDFFAYESCVVTKTNEVTIGKPGGSGILSFQHPASKGDLELDDDWNRPEASCQNRISRLSGSMFIAELKARAKCLATGNSADCRAEVNAEGAGTGNTKTDNRIMRAHRKVLGGIIRVCPAIDLSRLGFPHRCSWPESSLFTLSGLAECMFDGHHLDLIRYLDTLAPPSSKCGNQAVSWDEVLTAGGLDFTEECDDAPDNATEECSQSSPADCGAYCSMDCRAQACGDINNSGGPDNWDKQWISLSASNPTKRCDLEVCDTDGDGDVDENDAAHLDSYAGELFLHLAGLGPTPSTSLACRCGDGIVDQYEQCDDRGRGFCDDGSPSSPPRGNPQQPCYSDSDCSGVLCRLNTDGCKTGCIRAVCGDGIVWAGNEECDNGASNADLPDDCRTYCMLPMCGDGITDTGEDCDTDGESASCNYDCTPALCGDGHANPSAGEACDDSNTLAQDYCADDCSEVTGRCGDAIVQSRVEECDGGESGSSLCDPDCSSAECGDGYANSAAGEQCDDSNTISGDGCAANCIVEP
ncbi:MAG: hypothetical protein VB852_09610 [Deltaproteobacteria bacterium]